MELRERKFSARFLRMFLFIVVAFAIDGTSVRAEDEEEHNHESETSPATTTTSAPTPAPRGESVTSIDATGGSAKNPTRAEELVKELTKLKLSQEAATVIKAILEKNPDVDPKGFNERIDALAVEDPQLLTEAQVRALKDLFREELTSVPKERGKELANALKVVIEKMPKVPLDGKDPKSVAGAGDAKGDPAAAGNANGKAPSQEELLKQFTQTVSQTLGDTAKQLLAGFQQNQKSQAEAFQKAAKAQLDAGENPDLLKALRDLDKEGDDKRRDNASEQNETPTPPENNSGNDSRKADRKDDSKDKLLDLLKDKKDKERKEASNNNNNNGGSEKKEEKKEEKKDDKPPERKKRDDDITPPKKPSPTPTPTPTEAPPPEEPPVAGPETAPPKYSDLTPLQNDSGRFNFGGGSGPSDPAPIGGGGGGGPGGATSFDDSVFQVGGGMDFFSGDGGGRRGGSYGAPIYGGGGGGGGDEAEPEAGDAVDELPRANGRSGPPGQIIISDGGEPNQSAIAMVGTLGRKICDDETAAVGICQKLKMQRQRKMIRDNAGLIPREAGAR